MRSSAIVIFAAIILASASMAQAQSKKVEDHVAIQAGPSAPQAQAVPTTLWATHLSEQAQIDRLTEQVNILTAKVRLLSALAAEADALRTRVSTIQRILDALPPGFLGAPCSTGGWVSNLTADELTYSCSATHR